MTRQVEQSYRSIPGQPTTMYWQTIRCVVQPGRVNAAVDRYRASALALAQQDEGYSGCVVALNSGGSAFSVTTWWATEIDRATSRATGLSGVQAAQMSAWLVGEPVIRNGEVGPARPHRSRLP